MLFENAPTAFYRVVLAVVRRIEKQLNRLSNLVCPIDHTFEELRSDTAILGAVIHFYLKQWHLLLFRWRELYPPRLQGIDDKITGLVGTAEATLQLAGIFIDDAARNVGFFDAHIVVICLTMASREAAS